MKLSSVLPRKPSYILIQMSGYWSEKSLLIKQVSGQPGTGLELLGRQFSYAFRRSLHVEVMVVVDKSI